MTLRARAATLLSVEAELARRVVQGEVRAAARACRAVDDRLTGYRELLKALHPHTGKAWVLGVTGNPGAGKSTLTDRLVQRFRAGGERVAVVAIDPTSPFSGGAILGDRIRMQRHFEDPGVFIRSLATRGALGGLTRSARDVVSVLDAWGAAVVIVETVGVGQDELEITRAAHTTLVVVAPGLGDEIQAIKAGILECADVFAVNKADRDGAEAAVADLELMIALGGEAFTSAAKRGRGHTAATVRPVVVGGAGEEWTPPIARTVSTRGEGVDDLVAHLTAHRDWLFETEAGKRRLSERALQSLVQSFRDTVSEEAVRRLGHRLERTAERVRDHELDPYTATEELLELFARALRDDPSG